jgi:hypothetical protein
MAKTDSTLSSPSPSSLHVELVSVSIPKQCQSQCKLCSSSWQSPPACKTSTAVPSHHTPLISCPTLSTPTPLSTPQKSPLPSSEVCMRCRRRVSGVLEAGAAEAQTGPPPPSMLSPAPSPRPCQARPQALTPAIPPPAGVIITRPPPHGIPPAGSTWGTPSSPA